MSQSGQPPPEAAPSGAVGGGGGVREKIKTSSRPELEALAFKLLDTLRGAKEQCTSLQKEKKSSDELLHANHEELVKLKKDIEDMRNTGDSEDVAKVNELSSEIAALRAELCSAEKETERLMRESQRTDQEKDESSQRERRREKEDLEAAREMIAQLRSQLEDSRTEVATLKETRASADLFSLELADYDKKVLSLTKELKDARAAMECTEAARDALAEELSKLLEESGRTAAEGEKARESAEEMRRKSEEERARLAEMQLRIDDERKKKELLQEELTKERIALGRQLSSSQERTSRLEEVVEALRDEATRLRVDRESADARAEELTKEFDSFKKRAQYVLEQRAKEAEEEGPRREKEKEEGEKRQREIEDVSGREREARESLRRVESDLARASEQRDRLEGERRQARREAEEASGALANALDELRSLRMEAEWATEEAATIRTTLKETEKREAEGRTRREQLSRELDSVRERTDEERTRLETELAEERRRREEAIRQLDERGRERATRPAPIAAVYPQFSDSQPLERPPSTESGPFHLMTAGASASTSSLHRHFPLPGTGGASPLDETMSEVTPERGLESVLFGEEAADGGRAIDDIETMEEDPREEVVKLRTQLRWMREIHVESETTVANMEEQIRILKEEIRRLLRNEERVAHAGNTEYLKNVVLKFLTPERVAGERAQLLPILHTMLKLSESERDLLTRVANTPNPEDASAAGASSWGSYIPRWTGLQ